MHPFSLIMPQQVDDASHSLLTEVLKRCVDAVRCSDCALWLADTDHLHPILGHGPHSSRFIGSYKHPLTEGLMSMVYASGQPFCENNIQQNPQHSTSLDEHLEIKTDAMIVIPVVSSSEIRGVITCVHTSNNTNPNQLDQQHNFTPADMSELEYTAALAGRILETSKKTQHLQSLA